jgi:hypothetical protein
VVDLPEGLFCVRSPGSSSEPKSLIPGAAPRMEAGIRCGTGKAVKSTFCYPCRSLLQKERFQFFKV